MSCLVQSTAPAPEAARPAFPRSLLTALWLEQVLGYDQLV